MVVSVIKVLLKETYAMFYLYDLSCIKGCSKTSKHWATYY